MISLTEKLWKEREELTQKEGLGKTEAETVKPQRSLLEALLEKKALRKALDPGFVLMGKEDPSRPKGKRKSPAGIAGELINLKRSKKIDLQKRVRLAKLQRMKRTSPLPVSWHITAKHS